VVPEEGITLTGLIDGQYQLQEITPPTGYVITETAPVTFTVSDGAITSTDGTVESVRYTAAAETKDAEFIIPNTPGAELPHTGGNGTTIFYILGTILVTGCAIVLISRRRLRND
jgi:LPXTG-motif cell wall-anchored protein